MSENKNKEIKKSENSITIEIDGEEKTFYRGTAPVSLMIDIANYNIEREEVSEEEYEKLEERYGDTRSKSYKQNMAFMYVLGRTDFLHKTADLVSKVYGGQFTAEEFIQGVDVNDFEEVITNSIDSVGQKKKKTQSEHAKDFLKEKAQQ